MIHQALEKVIDSRDELDEFSYFIEESIENDDYLYEKLTENLSELFKYNGLEKEDGIYYDLNKKEGAAFLRILPKNSISLLQFDYVNEDYEIEFLTAKNVSLDFKRNDFNGIKELFLSGKYTDNKQNSIHSLHHKHIYDDRNTPKRITLKSFTNTERIRKVITTTIERV